MLHVVAFTFFTILLTAVTMGLGLMLYVARGSIARALQVAPAAPAPIAVDVSRIRVLRTSRDRRAMPPLRAAA